MTFGTKTFYSLWICCSLLTTDRSINASQDTEEIYYDATTYYFEALRQVEYTYSISEKGIDDKLKFVNSTANIILDYLMTADEEGFYEQIRQAENHIRKMETLSNEIFSFVYGESSVNKEPYVFNGIQTHIYYNGYHQNRPLTQEERDHFYGVEMQRASNVQMYPKMRLDREALSKLIQGLPYNFLISLQNEVQVSYEQLYNIRDAEIGKIINTPNHTMLAGNAPAVAAGRVSLYKVGGKELYFISCSSGHFHPLPESLIHMKNSLMALGVPEDAIISFGISYGELTHKVEKKRCKMIQTERDETKIAR